MVLSCAIQQLSHVKAAQSCPVVCPGSPSARQSLIDGYSLEKCTDAPCSGKESKLCNMTTSSLQAVCNLHAARESVMAVLCVFSLSALVGAGTIQIQHVECGGATAAVAIWPAETAVPADPEAKLYTPSSL
jgi:hypothetical protein